MVNIMTRDIAITALLEAFHGCTTRGENAKLFLETKNGIEVATLRVKLPASNAEQAERTNLGSAKTKWLKKKSPSTLKRDRERMATFIIKKKRLLESWGPSGTSTPAMKAPPPFTDSCTRIMEKPIENSCENDSLDSKSAEQESENEPEAKQGLTKQDFWDKFDELFNKLPAKNDLDNVLEKNDMGLLLEKKIDNDDEIFDESDRIEDAKQWAIKQKLSFANSPVQ